MNGISKIRGLLRHLAIFGLVGGTASTATAAGAWVFPYCDGYSGNNSTSASGATCDTPKSVDCWEDPSHNPPQWASGKTYARAQIRLCNTGVWQIRAYALQPLKAKMTELAGNYYYANAEAVDSSGRTIASTTDRTADGAASAWVTVTPGFFGAPVVVRASGYVGHT